MRAGVSSTWISRPSQSPPVRKTGSSRGLRAAKYSQPPNPMARAVSSRTRPRVA
ncbi:MAG: hypothetical protein LUE61_05960 [Clostridiales bacterium]|nr:hypothetical protein [Clostridiales bacterium]